MNAEMKRYAASLASREDLEKLFVLADDAKEEMRSAGIGVTGMDILETARDAIAMLQESQFTNDVTSHRSRVTGHEPN